MTERMVFLKMCMHLRISKKQSSQPKNKGGNYDTSQVTAITQLVYRQMGV